MASAFLIDKYTKVWNDEMNNIYEKLKSKLDTDGIKKLQLAQKNWIESNKNDLNFIENQFIISGYTGTQGYVMIANDRYKRSRKRTIELMEYYYLLENGLTFKYKSIN